MKSSNHFNVKHANNKTPSTKVENTNSSFFLGKGTAEDFLEQIGRIFDLGNTFLNK
ncbi:hypothetical protein [Aliikangiella maris]|uniref:Uncharacterized protein n=2 Tax=Aliikangiella maris TaxID=3162458 RepID=A0ABV2BW63_9GAMM